MTPPGSRAGAGGGSSRVRRLAAKFRRKAFVVRSMEEQKDRTESGADMHKVQIQIASLLGSGPFTSCQGLWN